MEIMSTPETVLITGASSGIGLEFARVFAAEGAQLVLVARSGEKLRQLAEELRARHGTRSEVVIADLQRPEAPREIEAALTQAGLAVDVLVNNAGFGDRGHVADLPLERQLAMVQVNVVALTELTRRLLPGMISRRRGGILNVASTAAFQPGPNMAVYYATKAFVLFFSEGLYEELAGTGVTSTCLCPGATATGFATEAKMESALLFRLGAMDAAEVARAGVRAFRKRRAVLITGLKNKLGALGARFSPRALVRKMTYALMR